MRRRGRWKKQSAVPSHSSEGSAIESAGVAESTVLSSLAGALKLPVHQDLAAFRPDAEFLRRFGIVYARSHQIIGLEHEGLLHVAICDREGYEHLDIVGRALRQQAKPLLATSAAIQKAINVAYSDRSSQAQQVIDAIDQDFAATRSQRTCDARGSARHRRSRPDHSARQSSSLRCGQGWRLGHSHSTLRRSCDGSSTDRRSAVRQFRNPQGGPRGGADPSQGLGTG